MLSGFWSGLTILKFYRFVEWCAPAFGLMLHPESMFQHAGDLGKVIWIMPQLGNLWDKKAAP